LEKDCIGLRKPSNWAAFSLPINAIIADMIHGNFLGAAIVAILYTVYILMNPLAVKWQMVLALVILNALTIVLMAFAFK
jgi:hypothetical protein